VTSALLEARDLSIHKGLRQLLKDVTLRVDPGDIWQLTGGNGIGKTSLLRSFARLASIEVYGDLSRCDDVLYTGHSAALKGAITPRQNLKYHPSGLCMAKDSEIDEALAAVGLSGYENALTARLSAGQKRRVALARLFLPSGRLWLLDEPFTALDVAGVAVLEQRFKAHAQAGGAVVFTSHQSADLGELLNVLDLEQFRGD
jgi:heme exporter protein A